MARTTSVPPYAVLTDAAPPRLVASTRDGAFHAFARRLGLGPERFVRCDGFAWEHHYPLSPKRARRAVAAGAVPATSGQWADWQRLQDVVVLRLLAPALRPDPAPPVALRCPELFAPGR